MRTGSRPQALKPEKQLVPLLEIRTDGDTQRREALSPEVIADYMERWREGANFPAVKAMYDGQWYWLWDGFYRVESARQAGISSIEVSFRRGTQSDAQWYSCCANKSHGVRRTRAEKEASITYALKHQCGVGMSNIEIGRFVGCSTQTVAKMRKKMEAQGEIHHTRFIATKGERVVSSQMGEEWAAKQVAVSRPRRRTRGVSRTEEEHSESLLDETGRPVPEDLRSVFEELFAAMAYARNSLRDAHHGIRRALDVIDVNRVMYGPKRIKLESYINTLADLIEEGERQKPYAVCACAEGPPMECQKCGGERWQSKSEQQKRAT